MSACQSTVLLT